MNRYFLDSAIADERSIQLDRNDAFVVWKIESVEPDRQASRILFDFSMGFGRAVNNTIHHRIVKKANFDGLIANVILRSGNCREVEQAEFDRIYACLDDKSLQLEKIYRRKRIVEVEQGMGELPLP
jgi:undecaprenyl pyrophosphate synthase